MGRIPTTANNPITRVEYLYGDEERRNVSVVQKDVYGAEKKNPIRHAWTRVGF